MTANETTTKQKLEILTSNLWARYQEFRERFIEHVFEEHGIVHAITRSSELQINEMKIYFLTDYDLTPDKISAMSDYRAGKAGEEALKRCRTILLRNYKGTSLNDAQQSLYREAMSRLEHDLAWIEEEMAPADPEWERSQERS